MCWRHPVAGHGWRPAMNENTLQDKSMKVCAELFMCVVCFCLQHSTQGKNLTVDARHSSDPVFMCLYFILKKKYTKVTCQSKALVHPVNIRILISLGKTAKITSAVGFE